MIKDTASNTSGDYGSEINVKELFKVLWQGKWSIFSITMFFSIAAVIYSLSLPNIYQSKALLTPVEDSGISQSIQGVGGLASLAGIDLSQNKGGKLDKALETMSTFGFFEKNILPNIFLPNLMAVESWDPKKNIIAYDKSIYDDVSRSWVRSYKYPQTQIPSAQESFEFFKEVITLTLHPDTGFLKIYIKHQSPFIAKKWTELIVTELNDSFRRNDKLEAQAAMNYLNEQMAQTQYTEIRQVIAALIEQKMQQMTLIEANPNYIFAYIDPPIVMEQKFEPVRSKISILGALLGGMLGILFILIRSYFSERRN